MTAIDFSKIFEYRDSWLYWKIKPAPKIRIGDRAGNKTGPGYWQVCYQGKFNSIEEASNAYDEALNFCMSEETKCT